MSYRIFKTIKLLLLTVLAVGLLAGPSFALTNIYLAAKEFPMAMPGGNPDVTMWGFALDPGGTCYNTTPIAARVTCVAGLTATVPGPRLDVPIGENDVRVFLTNVLPEPVSIVIPGQEMARRGAANRGPTWDDGSIGARPSDAARVRSFGREAGPDGGRRVYRWTSLGGAALRNPLQPGTYIYQSGTHTQVQVQMGLYGAIIRDAAANEAYTGVIYDAQRDLFFSEVDPALHAAVAAGTFSGSTLDYNPKYFLLQSYDLTTDPTGATVVDVSIDTGTIPPTCIDGGLAQDSAILLRMYNMGLRELAPMLIGSHFDLVAEGGKPYPFARTQYQTLLMPGSTKDAIFTPGYEGDFKLIERRLNLTDAAASGGGMQTCLTVGTISITVPDVVGLAQAAAEAAITTAGLNVGTVTTQASNTVPAGEVISQNPTGGTLVAPGSAVDLVVSSGPADIAVPNVVGLAQAAAEAAITTAGLNVGTVTTQASNTVPAGEVISQNPTGGTLVAPGSAVDLVVSSGPADIAVPNVVGLAQAAAEAAITTAGLNVGTVTTQASNTVPAGEVISQNPTGGTLVAPGSAVDLVVSSGPADIAVPNVVGLAQAAAEAAITTAGLNVGTVTTQASNTVPAGEVISQNPTGGTLVAPGSAVDLVVSSGPVLIDVPNVVGLTQAAAEAAITTAGLNVGTVTTQTSNTVPAGDVISQNPASGTQVAPNSAVDLVVSLGAAALFSEDFETYAAGDDPVDWFDTGAGNSLTQNDSLFKVFDLTGQKVFGTTSTATNIHSHYVGAGSNTLSGYEYTGRLMKTASGGGIGVTILSQYPASDTYYRLRQYSGNSQFHISPHGTSITGGDINTGVVPAANVWYLYRIQVEVTGSRTDIRAKVWPEGGSEPVDWQANAFDDSASQLTTGTFGLWSMQSGAKYWDDLTVQSIP